MTERQLARHLRRYRWLAVHTYRLDEMRLGGLPEWGLERLVDQAQVCGAPLVLVTLPTLFRDQPGSFTAAIRARREYLTRWAEVPGVTYLDLSSLAASMELADFSDPSHLSSCGAARVTDELAAVILEEFGALDTSDHTLAAAAVTQPPLRSPSSQ